MLWQESIFANFFTVRFSYFGFGSSKTMFAMRYNLAGFGEQNNTKKHEILNWASLGTKEKS